MDIFQIVFVAAMAVCGTAVAIAVYAIIAGHVTRNKKPAPATKSQPKRRR